MIKKPQQPINKFSTYESLINEFYIANPNPTDAELSSACLYFADKCGLTVATKAKPISRLSKESW